MTLSGSALQARLGSRVRQRRTELGLTIQHLADAAGLSARVLSDVETGRTNVSIGRLAGLADALGVPLTSLLRRPHSDARAAIDELLAECDEAQLQAVRSMLEVKLGRRRPAIVALLGMRGAGKSTIGPLLARALSLPFVELADRIEERAGMSIGDIFTLHGEGYYRGLELECFDDLVDSGERCVAALPGGIVGHESARERIAGNCTSVWLRADPEDHWSRVFAQGDTRPMEGRTDAMADLYALIERREPLYARSDLVADTSQATPADVVRNLVDALDARGLRP